jgi:hypothetical protein
VIIDLINLSHTLLKIRSCVKEESYLKYNIDVLVKSKIGITS